MKPGMVCAGLVMLLLGLAGDSYADTFQRQILLHLSDRHFTAGEEIHQRFGEQANGELKRIAISGEIPLHLRTRAVACMGYSPQSDNSGFLSEIASTPDSPLALRQEAVTALARKGGATVDHALGTLYGRAAGDGLRPFIVATLRQRQTEAAKETLRAIDAAAPGKYSDSGVPLRWNPAAGPR